MGKSRVTMADVAKAAGVGVATVDRVLNRRAPVRQATAERVLDAATQLGYHGQALLRRRIEEGVPERRLGFILQKQSKPFYRQLAREIDRAVRDLRLIRATAHVAYVDALSPDDLSNAIENMAQRVNAMAVVAIDHPRVATAIETVSSQGCPVFAMLSPLTCPQVSGYVGIDGRKAGRTAGWAMARHVRAGQIGILVGSHRYLGHEALEVGFRSYMREHAPHMRLRDSLVYLDDAAVAYEAASELLRRSPDLAGLYHCGGGVSGVLRALSDSGHAGRLAYICHEISPLTRQGLHDGSVSMVIATPVASVAQETSRAMERALAGGAADPLPPLDFRIITPENA